MSTGYQAITMTRQTIVALSIILACVSCSDQKGRKLTTNKTSNASEQDTDTGKRVVTLPKRNSEITVSELKSALEKNENIFLLDVRSRAEYEAGHIAEVDVLIPHTQILSQVEMPKVDTSQYIYCICRSGHRSGYVTRWLRKNGYSHSYSVIGGMLAWAKSGYPVTH